MSLEKPQVKAGFSEKANSPEFAQFKAKTKKATKIFLYFLVLACWVGFPALALTGNVEMSTALLQAAVVSGIIILLSAFGGRKINHDITWTGTIVDKKIEQRRVREHYDEETHYINKTFFVIYIKRDTDQKIISLDLTVEEPYRYFAVGDRIKHHAGFSYYEKEDKTGDIKILCICCGRMNNIQESNCTFCKMPLMN